MKSRTPGAVAGRNDKRKALEAALEQARSYVQTTANAGPPESAQQVVESAGMSIRKPVIRQKQGFAATDGDVSGSVKLTTVSAGRRASYEWQQSLDGGKTWVMLPATLQAKTTVSNLPPNQTVMFRSRAVTKSGEGDWSQTVSHSVR